MRIVCVAFGLLLSAPAFADQTVILGKFSRQYVLDAKPDCLQPEDKDLVALCMDAWIGFEIATTRTLVGAPVARRVRVARVQHALFSNQFFRTFRSKPVLLVLNPIRDAETRKKLKSDYYMVELSVPESMYCLYQSPESYGLGDQVPMVHTSPDRDHPRHCFELKE